jgi:hypothetical protein
LIIAIFKIQAIIAMNRINFSGTRSGGGKVFDPVRPGLDDGGNV